jgi:hypothetical protein
MAETKKTFTDPKFLITIIGLVALLGGFYYTTNLRLDGLEVDVQSLKKNNDRLLIVEERLKVLQEKTDLIYEVILKLDNRNTNRSNRNNRDN